MGNQGANISVTNQTECREGAGFFFSTPTLLEEAEISRCICTRNKATSRHYKGKRCPRKTVAPQGHKEPKKQIKVPTQPTRQHGLPQSARSVTRNKALESITSVHKDK